MCRGNDDNTSLMSVVALGRVLITFFITARDDQRVFYHAILLS